MLSVVCGITTAVTWGSSIVVASRSSRLIGSRQALAYNMLISLPLAAVLALVVKSPSEVRSSSIGWALLGGAGSVLGAWMTYKAVRLGKIGVIAPIVSTEGALAALFSILFFGETVGPAVGAALAAVSAGIVIVTLRGDARTGDLRPPLFAVAAAASYGVALVAASRATIGLGPLWTACVARVIGVLFIALPLILTRRLPRPGRAWWMVTFSGVADMTGYVSFMVGSKDGVAVVAVLASQAAAIAVLISYVVFGERMSSRQIMGMVVIGVGVTALAAIQG